MKRLTSATVLLALGVALFGTGSAHAGTPLVVGVAVFDSSTGAVQIGGEDDTWDGSAGTASAHEFHSDGAGSISNTDCSGPITITFAAAQGGGGTFDGTLTLNSGTGTGTGEVQADTHHASLTWVGAISGCAGVVALAAA
jgi:hypothetical protein